MATSSLLLLIMPCFYIFCKELLTIYYTFCDELWRYRYTFCKELYDSPTHTVISPPRIALLCTSSTGGLLVPLLTNPLILRLVIISFRPAWLARVLLSFKRTQSSGND